MNITLISRINWLLQVALLAILWSCNQLEESPSPHGELGAAVSKNQVPFFNLTRYRPEVQYFTIFNNGSKLKEVLNGLNIRSNDFSQQHLPVTPGSLMNLAVTIKTIDCSEPPDCKTDSLVVATASFTPDLPNKQYFSAIFHQPGEPTKYTLLVQEDQHTPPQTGFFKIRLFNARLTIDNQSTPVSLGYSNNAPVAAPLTNVPFGKLTDYIEIPYGSYRFKLVDEAGTEILIDEQRTGSMTYQAGGVYTILIPAVDESIPQNPIVWQDALFGEGNALAKVMFANADPSAGSIQIRLNGTPIADSTYALGEYSTYFTVGENNASVEFLDRQGQVLAASNYPVRDQDNLTAFLVDNKGRKQVLWVPNSFAPSLALTANSDKVPDARFDIRAQFLNLTTDAQAISFLFNSQNVLQVAKALHIYQLAVRPQWEGSNNPYSDNLFGAAFPYVLFGSGLGIGEFGDGLPTVNNAPEQLTARVTSFSGNQPADVVRAYPFVANPSQYEQNGAYTGPKGEPGTYLVALVGSVVPNVPPDQKARIVVIKNSL